MHWFIFLFVSLIFLFSPYQKGLYFDSDFYSLHILISALTILLILTAFRFRETLAWKDIHIIILIPILYMISITYAVYINGAFAMFFKWTSYISLFYLLYWTIKKSDVIRELSVYIFYLSGTMIGVHMLLNYYDILSYPHVFINDRFAGVFQYPNTFGMVVIAFYMFGLIQLLQDKIKWYQIWFYTLPLTLFILIFIESYSRGMFLVFPMVAFIGLFFMKFHMQISYIIYAFITILGGFISYILLQVGNDIVSALSIITVMLCTSLMIYWLKTRGSLSNYFRSYNKKNNFIILPIVTLLLSGLFVLDIAYKGIIYQQLPETLQDRISSINESHTARERILIYEDSLEASQNSPIWGYGGNAWESIYRAYQQLPYQAKRIHNEYLEMIIDLGYLGFMIMISVIIYFVYVIWRRYTNNHENMQNVAIILSLMTIFAHSFLDFNLAFGYVGFMIFWLIAMGIKPSSTFRIKPLWSYLTLSILLVLSLVTAIFSYRFMQADNMEDYAQNTNDLASKEQYITEAIQWNSFQPAYYTSLIQTLLRADNNDREEIYALTNKMIEVEPLNSSNIYKAARFQEMIEFKKEALDNYQLAARMDQYDTRIYASVISLSIELAGQTGDDHFIELAHETFEEFDNILATFNENSFAERHNSREFGETEELKRLREELVKIID
ncbi:O-antigen ligase family protein [Gracilibacillus massiliensis]|uniref:O-antigen ligase family protein n=1 Tax=Gracilibacillus massiliensis TaxID=1564956 RepID=UPI00071CFE28|nr:O-antigen ligase family protein [Gracilibacillus massiliensis]